VACLLVMLGFNRAAGNDPSAPGLESSSSAVLLRDQDRTVAILKDSATGNGFTAVPRECTKLNLSLSNGVLIGKTRAGLDTPSRHQQGRIGIARGCDDYRRA
jgi:hypothetical protein